MRQNFKRAITLTKPVTTYIVTKDQIILFQRIQEILIKVFIMSGQNPVVKKAK